MDPQISSNDSLSSTRSNFEVEGEAIYSQIETANKNDSSSEPAQEHTLNMNRDSSPIVGK